MTALIELGIKTMPYNALVAAGITTVEKLSEMTVNELYRIPYLGRKGIAEIEEKMEKRQMALKIQLPAEIKPLPEGKETPITALGFRPRAVRLLMEKNCVKLSDVLNLTPKELRLILGVGFKQVCRNLYVFGVLVE